MTTAQKIARAQKAGGRREYEQSLILKAGGGTVAHNRFLASLYEWSYSGKYLSVKQLAAVERMITEQEVN